QNFRLPLTKIASRSYWLVHALYPNGARAWRALERPQILPAEAPFLAPPAQCCRARVSYSLAGLDLREYCHINARRVVCVPINQSPPYRGDYLREPLRATAAERHRIEPPPEYQYLNCAIPWPKNRWCLRPCPLI